MSEQREQELLSSNIAEAAALPNSTKSGIIPVPDARRSTTDESIVTDYQSRIAPEPGEEKIGDAGRFSHEPPAGSVADVPEIRGEAPGVVSRAGGTTRGTNNSKSSKVASLGGSRESEGSGTILLKRTLSERPTNGNARSLLAERASKRAKAIASLLFDPPAASGIASDAHATPERADPKHERGSSGRTKIEPLPPVLLKSRDETQRFDAKMIEEHLAGAYVVPDLQGASAIPQGARYVIGGELPKPWRMLRPGGLATRDYKPDRMNLHVSENFCVGE